jgi:hypothetical protein
MQESIFDTTATGGVGIISNGFWATIMVYLMSRDQKTVKP